MGGNSDDDTTPPLRRSPSIMGDDERARSGSKHRTPAKGVHQAETFEENSENYSGEALRQFREERFTIPERVSKLEGKMDDVKADVKDIKGDVKGLVTSNATVVSKLDTYMTMQQQAQARPHSDSLMRVVKETATETTTATLATRVLDQQDASVKFRRKFVLSTLKIIGVVAGSGTVGAVVHWLLGKI